MMGSHELGVPVRLTLPLWLTLGRIAVIPLVLILLTTIGYALGARRIQGATAGESGPRVTVALRSAVGDVKENMRATGAVLAAGAYASATPALAALVVSAAGVAGYSSGERLYKFGLLAVVAVANSLQGWVIDERPVRPQNDAWWRGSCS